MAGQYIPEWQRADCPTHDMNDTQTREYWKQHAVHGDAAFALREGHGKPADLAMHWAALLLNTIERETVHDRQRRDVLRTATRRWMAGQTYTLQIVTASTPVPVKVRKRCPHCGHEL